MKLHIENTTIQLPGIKREYHFYHVSDAHITYAAAEDSEEERNIMERDHASYASKEGFAPPLEVWDLLKEHIKEDKDADALLVTGDMFSFFNLSTYHLIRSMLRDFPLEVLYTPGNHEFCTPPSGQVDIQQVYHEYYDALMCGDADFWVRDYEDFLIIGINNSDHDITPSQMERFREQAARNLPILLLMHVAVRSDSYIETIKQNWQGLNMYFLFENNDSARNKEFSDLIRSPQGNVSAIIAGHVHAAHEGEYAPGKMQYVAAPLHEKYVRKITIIPC